MKIIREEKIENIAIQSPEMRLFQSMIIEKEKSNVKQNAKLVFFVVIIIDA
jgi:hypothetical protein